MTEYYREYLILRHARAKRVGEEVIKLGLLLLSQLLIAQSVFGQSVLKEPHHVERLAVIYPEIREPYRQVFLNMHKGIERSFEGELSTYVLKKKTTTDELYKWLNKQNVNGVIVLGNRSMRAALLLPSSPLTVVGAVLIQPNAAKLPTITLVPSPKVLFKKIKKILPKVKRIQVVYRQVNEWFIEQSIKQASKHGLIILSHKAENVSEMAYKYRQVLSDMDPHEDALWIAPYGRSPDKTISKVILEESWRNKLSVISSNLADVKRGALFSFYTNNVGMGKELVSFWHNEQLNDSTEIKVQASESIETAINLRTANHLNLHYTKQDRQMFGLMYPTPQN